MEHSEYVIRIAEIEQRQVARKRAKVNFHRDAIKVYQNRLAEAKAEYDHQLENYDEKYRAEQDADEQLKLQTKIEYLKSKEAAEKAIENGGGYKPIGKHLGWNNPCSTVASAA